MYFHKYVYESNFEFLAGALRGGAARIGPTVCSFALDSFEDDVYRITVRGKAWPKPLSQSNLQPPARRKRRGSACRTRLEVSEGLGLTLRDADGAALLTSPRNATFGLCGKSSLFQFDHRPGTQYYGMGEKSLGLERSGVRTKFWNTDVWADFHSEAFTNGKPDPMYASVPYLIVKRDNTYVGLLLDNPFATFMSTGKPVSIAGQMSVKDKPAGRTLVGAEDGMPVLYILYGPTLRELTGKLQRLVGVTPLPPAWALGYQQCRWGYKNDADLEELDRNFRKHAIPCDGLWLDIDYMNGYRVFTFDKTRFADPRKTCAKFARRGRRIVPIIDPGVKREKGYAVYDSGRRKDAFCRNPQGGDYIGLVWPGETVFPDFSVPHARDWWAEQVKGFADTGFAGAWIDMNDPATGPADNMQMLFNRGREPHESYHSQYALGMAQATREGFLRAHPEARPFLLCRSAFTGTSRYSAVWTGDNVSNRHHLKGCIAMTLNLALSGIPFNGPDIGGFGGNTNPLLLADWMKCCCLFPVCRNHSIAGSAQQEPWVFGARTMRIVREYIRLRYRFRPYLYNLFAGQEQNGDAILRPLFYDFADTEKLPLGTIADQFMVGPFVMQAPLLEEKPRTRGVVLPGPGKWYSLMEGAWLAGGRRVTARPGALQSPVYVREGAILPLAPEPRGDNAFDARRVAFHVFLRRAGGAAECTHTMDDGASFAYRNGKRSVLQVRATAHRGKLEITTSYTAKGFGKARPAFVLYDRFAAVTIDGRPARLRAARETLAGSKQACWIVL